MRRVMKFLECFEIVGIVEKLLLFVMFVSSFKQLCNINNGRGLALLDLTQVRISLVAWL